MRVSISTRIKRSMLSLTLGICIAFTCLSLFLVYIIEDQVFVNVLRNESIQFEQVPETKIGNWKPASRYMKLVHNLTDLPHRLQSVVKEKRGIYEYFDQGEAYFILSYQRKDNQQQYFITYDVSALLAVRDTRSLLLISIAVVSFVLFLIATIVAIRLSRKTLRPLKKLTDQLEDEKSDDLPVGFAKDFAGDEVGILAMQLEKAIERAQMAANREFEFNSGVSHELRSPIQIAQNSVELLEFSQVSSASGPLQRLKRSITQMKQITEAFLWLASDRSLQQSVTNGKQVMEVLIANYQQTHPTREIRVEFDGDPQYAVPQPVFTVIIDNLLRNAVQHGDEGEILCHLKQQSILIHNSITPGATAATERYGIGLMIVKRICERLNWQLLQTANNTDGMSAVIKVINSQGYT